MYYASVADLGFFKEGFKNIVGKVVGPRPLPVSNLAFVGRLVNTVTLFALHCDADCNVLHVASHLVAGKEVIIASRNRLLATVFSDHLFTQFSHKFLTLISFWIVLIRRSLRI